MAAETYAYEQLDASSVAPLASVPGDCNFGWVQVEGDTVRYQLDGTDPTASVGMQLFASQPPLQMSVEKLNAARFLTQSSGGLVNVTYVSTGPQ